MTPLCKIHLHIFVMQEKNAFQVFSKLPCLLGSPPFFPMDLAKGCKKIGK